MRSIVSVVSCARTRRKEPGLKQAHSPAKFLFKETVKWCTIYASFLRHIYCSRNHWAKTTYTEIFWLEIYLEDHIWIPPAIVSELNLNMSGLYPWTLLNSPGARHLLCAQLLWILLGSSRLSQIPRAHALECSYKRLENNNWIISVIRIFNSIP